MRDSGDFDEANHVIMLKVARSKHQNIKNLERNNVTCRVLPEEVIDVLEGPPWKQGGKGRGGKGGGS